MRHTASLAGALFVAWFVGSFAGCDSKTPLTPPMGSGGLVGAGGAIATGGLLGSGAAIGLSSTGGTGSPYPRCDAGASDGATDAIPPFDPPICEVVPSVPRAFPWIVTPSQAAGSQAGGTAGTGGTIASGCQTSDGGLSVVCAGSAWLRPNGGVGGIGGNIPSVTWDDGSMLSWYPGTVSASIVPPIAVDASPQRVWAQLETHESASLSPYCGPLVQRTMELRDTASGPIQFLARDGFGLAEPSSEQLISLFGVDADTVPLCSYDTLDGTGRSRKALNNHVLRTSPAQTIPYVQAQQVTTPNGVFAVVWYSRSTTVLVPPTCGACVSESPAVSFVASRLQ